MSQWNQLASDQSIEKAAAALKANNMDVIIVNDGEEAKKKLLELIPEKSEVMTMTSRTLDEIGAAKELNESGKYDAVKPKLYSMNRETQGREMRKLGAAPDYATGSVHAVTEDGHVLIASASGSQLPGYIYGAGKVVWVVGTQKIVKTVEDGINRIKEYVFPLEDERAQKAYGIHSSINKIVIDNKEPAPGRVTMILIKQSIGF